MENHENSQAGEPPKVIGTIKIVKGIQDNPTIELPTTLTIKNSPTSIHSIVFKNWISLMEPVGSNEPLLPGDVPMHNITLEFQPTPPEGLVYEGTVLSTDVLLDNIPGSSVGELFTVEVYINGQKTEQDNGLPVGVSFLYTSNPPPIG